ncbi:YcaO-like family protein [Acrocarpospora catenulata]|uniref:YcaO-like family protein n=1 Tax=Acrocarpospora catenulata TaxID=2836182 RepID=UPI001BDA51F2|nr:YcaO-like family protein [Acrocarpospora catenulata]
MTSPEDLLVDPRTGVLTALARQRRRPGLPRFWLGYGSAVADTRRHSAWTADRFGFGAAAGDAERARLAALGEAVERYCGNAVPDGLVTASWRRLGGRALDPETIPLYSAAQYATPGFPFRKFTRDLEVAWTPATDLATGAEVLVPASMVWLDYFHGPREPEPATHALAYSGIAAGHTRAQAERFALEELFERDATTIWWASGATVPTLADPERITARLGEPADGEGPRVRLLPVPSEFGVPVLAAFLEDTRERIVAFGSACRADPAEAAVKALVEAYGLYALALQLADPSGEVWQAMAGGTLEGHVFRPYRADRRYRDAFRADYRDLTDLPAIAQLYLDPDMQGAPLDRLRAGPGPRLADLSAADPGSYLDRLAAAGLTAYSVDLTTSDVRAAGLCVVRMLAPGLVGNAPPAFPLRGGARLYRTPRLLGLTDRDLTEDDLFPHPLPLA